MALPDPPVDSTAAVARGYGWLTTDRRAPRRRPIPSVPNDAGQRPDLDNRGFLTDGMGMREPRVWAVATPDDNAAGAVFAEMVPVL